MEVVAGELDDPARVGARFALLGELQRVLVRPRHDGLHRVVGELRAGALAHGQLLELSVRQHRQPGFAHGLEVPVLAVVGRALLALAQRRRRDLDVPPVDQVPALGLRQDERALEDVRDRDRVLVAHADVVEPAAIMLEQDVLARLHRKVLLRRCPLPPLPRTLR